MHAVWCGPYDIGCVCRECWASLQVAYQHARPPGSRTRHPGWAAQQHPWAPRVGTIATPSCRRRRALADASQSSPACEALEEGAQHQSVLRGRGGIPLAQRPRRVFLGYPWRGRLWQGNTAATALARVHRLPHPAPHPPESSSSHKDRKANPLSLIESMAVILRIPCTCVEAPGPAWSLGAVSAACPGTADMPFTRPTDVRVASRCWCPWRSSESSARRSRRVWWCLMWRSRHDGARVWCIAQCISRRR
jgi:hypothetical protein